MSDRNESNLATLVVILVIIAAVFVYKREHRPVPTQGEAAVSNPTRAEFTSPDHDKIARYEFDVIDASGGVVQTLIVPKSNTTLTNGIVSMPIALYPLTPGVYTSRVRGVTTSLAPSQDNERVPPAAAIYDSTLAKWTISGQSFLKDGQPTGGAGSELLWHAGKLYGLGTNALWYVWNPTTAVWDWFGATDPAPGVVANPSAGNGAFAVSVDSNASNPWARAPIAVY
jgi:hypothetical protein